MGARVERLIDGRRVEADVVEVADGVYSILDRRPIARSARRRNAPLRAHHFRRCANLPHASATRAGIAKAPAKSSAEGRQQVNAPMPGKVVRLLVKAGEAVKAGQGIVVVMKR